MALLFSAVTVTAGYNEAEFTAGGIPREYDDLVGWTAFDDFMENVDAETEVSVHAEAYLTNCLLMKRQSPKQAYRSQRVCWRW